MTGRLLRGWRAWWFPPVPLERLGLFRIAVATFAFLDVAFFSDYVLRYAEVDRTFFDPIYLLQIPQWLGIGGVPVPSSMAGFAVLYVVMLVALLAAVVGFRARIALAVGGVLYLYHWAVFNSWGKVNHGKIPVIAALLVLTVAPSAARYSVDAWRRRRACRPPVVELDPVAGWALRVVGVLLVAAYLLSVLAKLDNAGIGWPLEPIVQLQLMVGGDGGVAAWLADRPVLLHVMQALSITVEAAAFLALAGGWLRNVVLAALAGFHLGSYLLLETEFFGFLICYSAFFRLERLPAWVAERVPRALRPALPRSKAEATLDVPMSDAPVSVRGSVARATRPALLGDDVPDAPPPQRR